MVHLGKVGLPDSVESLGEVRGSKNCSKDLLEFIKPIRTELLKLKSRARELLAAQLARMFLSGELVLDILGYTVCQIYTFFL